jgi:hypothetical protein
LPALLPTDYRSLALSLLRREAAVSFPSAMDTHNTGKEALFNPGCEPVVEEEERRRLLWLMAEYFRTIGCTDIKARLPGFMPPPVLSGTIEDHRPDFTCRQSDSARTPIILEIVTPNMVEDPVTENRWSLLSSAAKLYNAELHFVIPKWAPRGAVDQVLKRRLARMELTANRVWTV